MSWRHDVRSATRLAVVQGLYQIEVSGLSCKTVINQFLSHQKGAVGVNETDWGDEWEASTRPSLLGTLGGMPKFAIRQVERLSRTSVSRRRKPGTTNQDSDKRKRSGTVSRSGEKLRRPSASILPRVAKFMSRDGSKLGSGTIRTARNVIPPRFAPIELCYWADAATDLITPHRPLNRPQVEGLHRAHRN